VKNTKDEVADEKYNEGNSTGHMWIVKRSMQSQGNIVVKLGSC